MKIRINKLPKQLTKALVGRQVQGSLAITPYAMGGGDYSNSLANKKTQVRETLQPIDRDVANLEAEKGEYAYGGISGDNIPDNFKIGGKRHSQGGTPLNLPQGSFIFSDTASMKIKDPAVLKMFDLKPKKGGFTPADIAKKYDINSYKKILYDPNTDELTRKTATIMIKNYVMKLGYLSIIQEAMKGFPQGMPEAAQPVLETMGYSMEQFIPEPVQQGQQEIMAQEESENGMPTEMPDGQPVASMETMYGDDANAQQMPVNPPMPMAEYGMTLGGYDMPMYPDGGVTVNNIPATRTTTAPGEGWNKGTVVGAANNAEGYYRTSAEQRNYQRGAYRPRVANPQPYNAAGKKSLCNRLMQGATIADLVAENLGTTAGLNALLADCIPQAEEKFKEKQEAVYLESETPPSTPPETIPPKKKKCRCVDPQTGEETITEITQDEECDCPSGYSLQGFQDTPVYSDIASRNILTQATMNPNVPRSSSVLPAPVEAPGAYKDYLADIQNIGRGQSAMMNMIQGTAGSAGDDFAKAMATTAQTQAANQAAVSKTQEDNINAARQVGQFNAQIKNLNNAQRADVLNAQIKATANEKGMENMARNQIAQNEQMGIADAEAELQQRMDSNFINEQYGTTYRRGVPFFKQGKPNVPEKSSDVNKRIKELQAIYGKDAKMGDLLQIIKMEQQQNTKRGGQAKGGPYVLASSIYPFIL
jgi:hypothetical protein